MTKIPTDDVVESLYKLSIRESGRLKTVLELYDMKIHQKISMPNYQKLKTMVKRGINQKLRLRNSDARNEEIEIGAVVTRRRGSRGIEREEREFAVSGTQKVRVREETHAVSDTRVMIVKSRHQKPLHPLSHQHQEVEVRREKRSFRGRSQSWAVQPRAVQKLLERYLH